MDKCIKCKKRIPEGAERIMAISSARNEIIHTCLKCAAK